MSQDSEESSSYAINTRRTTRALVPPTARSRKALVPAKSASVAERSGGWYAVPLLLVLGALLECLLFALLPLFAGSNAARDPVERALPDLFPWLVRLYWTTLFPQALSWLGHVAWLDPAYSTGNANLQLLLLGLALLLSLLAARLGYRVVRFYAASAVPTLLFWLTICFAALAGLILLFAPVQPGAFSQDMLNYGLYGRMVVVYHVNPYAAGPTLLAQDMLHVVVTNVPGHMGVAAYGPVWLDISLLVALFAQASVANILLGFRLLGLACHLLNTTVIWSILKRTRPELRLSATLLYAWNPLALVVSVVMMHQDVVIALFFVLAVYFLLRRAALMSWIFALLAVLVNPFYLVLLPLFLAIAFRQSLTLRLGQLVLWWLTFWIVTALVVALAFAPYWQELGVAGLWANLLQVFWQALAINSLDAALLSLPAQLPHALAWLFLPLHWSIVVLAIVALFLLVCTLWLADSVELLALCASWVLLLLLLLMPTYWPWYVLMPLVLALCSSSQQTIRLVILLTLGGLLCYYCWLWQPVWAGQALLTLGLLFLVWIWLVFFTASWRRKSEGEEVLVQDHRRNGAKPWLVRSSHAVRRQSL